MVLRKDGYFAALAALIGCTGGFQLHGIGGGGNGGASTFEPQSGGSSTSSPHPNGGRYLAIAEKIDNPRAGESFRSQDSNDRWRYYDQMLEGEWSSFKHQFGLEAGASATIDAESFEADWAAQLQKDVGSTLTGPDYDCPLAFSGSATSDPKAVLAQSKQCMEALKSIKGFRCVDRPKQQEHMVFDLQSDGTLIMYIHDPHIPDSSMNLGDTLEQYAKIFPKCKNAVEAALR